MRQTFINMQYDTAPDGGGGNSPAPYLTLSDLDNLPDKPAEVPLGGNITPGDTPPPPAPEPDPNAPLTTDPPAPEPAPEPDPEPEPEPTEDEPELDVEGFFTEVEQITGEPIKVEYPEGVDPLTPQGIAVRDQALRDLAIEKFEAHLKQRVPRAYAYMLHLDAGGTEEEFFAERTVAALPDEATFKTSIEAQTRLLKQDLTDRGVPEDVAQATVDKYVKDNVATTKAMEVYTNRKEAQAAQLAQLEQLQAQQEQQFQAQITGVTTSIEKAISSNGLKFIIPEAKKPEFYEHVKNNLRYDDSTRKFYLTTEVGDNLAQVLEAQYFQYVKGDLNALVESKAKTLTTHKLRAKVVASQNGNQSKTTQQNTNPGFIPLGSL